MHITLPAPAENALSKLQDTELTPMEEALFKAWTKANHIEKPDSPDDTTDYRGIFKHTGGAILPNGQLKRFSEKLNAEDKLQKVLQDRMLERLQQATGAVKSKEEQQFKAERQDITHKQKMQMEGMKLKRLPHDAKMKELDVHKQAVGIESQKLGNEAKELDLAKSVFAPAPATVSAPKEPSVEKK